MDSQATTLTIRIAGYDFDGPHTDARALRSAPGIYVIADLRSDGRWWILDVGESEDVCFRVTNHDRATCWQHHRQGTVGAAVLYTSGWTAEHRRMLESQIRNQFNPPCGER